MSSLLDGFPAYREEVFIRLVTDSSRADAVKMSDAGFGRLSTADLVDLIRRLIQGDILPPGHISVDGVD